jgi:hypothetical protein
MTAVILAGSPEFIASQITALIGLGNRIYSMQTTRAKCLVIYGV